MNIVHAKSAIDDNNKNYNYFFCIVLKSKKKYLDTFFFKKDIFIESLTNLYIFLT